MFQERWGWLVLGTMIIVFYSRSQYMSDLLFEEDDQRQIRPMKGLIIATAVIFILSRIVFSRGFYINWN